MRMSFVNLIILFSFLLPGVQTSLADLSPNTPDESRGLIYLPGSHNDWDLDADNLVPTREFLGGAIAYYGTTIAASLDGEFKIVDGDWAHNWGAGYWITDYDIRWTIGWDGTNAAWKGSPGTFLHITIQQPEDYYNSVLPVGILSLSAMPVTVGQVSEAGEPFNDGLIAPGEQLIQCSLSGTPSPEEIIYLRYSTDGWATFHFLEMMGSGSERSATIPDYPIGTAIAYYVMSTTLSFQTGNALDNYPDLMTISYNTNLGNNFNYSVCGDSDGDGLCNDLDPEPDCITNDTDDCGVCGGNNIDMDCADVCFGNAVDDCAGICNGSAAIDDCGICAGGTTGLIHNANDLGCGCFELAPQPWCSDVDQDGQGDPASQTDYCPADIPDGWVTDCSDTTPSGSFILEYGALDISGYPTGSLQIMYTSSFSVSLLIFNLSGLTLSNATISPDIAGMDAGGSGTTVTIYSPSGTDYLLPGSGLLATVYFQFDYVDGSESCLSIQDIFDDMGNSPETFVGNCTYLTLPPQDCADVPNGPNVLDDCGVCDDDPANDNDAQDCTGLCFGTAVIDDCGFCSGGDTDLIPNADKDCAGVCFGDAVEDCAGECNGPAVVDPNEDCCQPDELDLCGICNGSNLNMDCNADCFGSAIIDDCFYCVEGNSGDNFNFMMDDCGVCEGNNEAMDCTSTCFGDAQEDCLGICEGTALPDCNYECNGIAEFDDCGICSGGTTGLTPNADWDCAGVCFGDAIEDCSGTCNGVFVFDDYDGCCSPDAIDECGQCFGGNQLCSGCMDPEACNYDPDAWVPDISDCEYPPENFDCNGNCLVEFDCLGECGGTAVWDGGSCCQPEDLGECGLCWGVGDGDIDCAGVCFGQAFVDDCDVCSGGSTGIEPNASMDCSGECYGLAIENECGCVGGTTGFDTDFCYGCTDPEAYNYDEIVTIDDGSCQYQQDLYLYFGQVDELAHTIEVWMNATGEVSGFQFNISGVYLSDFVIGFPTEFNVFPDFEPANGYVFFFQISDESLPAGEYLLGTALYSDILEIETCLLNSLFASQIGQPPYNVIIGDCYTFLNIEGCVDPLACNYNPDASIDDGSCEYASELFDCDGNCLVEIDCLGECGGLAFIDDCGVCFDQCEECDYEPNFDCNGDCIEGTPGWDGGAGGTAFFDECDSCVGGNTELIAGWAMDCAGVCYGEAIIDDCGGCVLPGFPPGNADCADVCYGNAIIDDCGVCAGGTTGLELNADMDCNGECFGGAIENECGCVEGATGLDADFCYGCTDPEAYNFDETATIDDGSCVYQQDLYLYFGEVDEQAHTMEVWMNAPDEVSGFQFVITGIYLTGVYGGVTDFSPHWPISTSYNGSVIGFVFWNNTLPAGDYFLGIFTYSEILDFESCLTEPVFSTPPGNPPYNVIVGDCYTFLNIEGCTDPEADNYNPDASIDDGSCEYDLPGDITQDGLVDVVDVVFMVDVILQETLLPEAQMIAGDLYQDGVITILDLVWLINIILGDDLALQVPMTATTLTNLENEISVDIPDGISAMQIDFEGDFSITQSFLPAGWQFTKNDHRIILFSMDGSPLTQSKLIRYSGDVTIQSALAVDRTLNQRQLSLPTEPTRYSLVEVYPNPFNPDVSIRYYLEASFPVQLMIYDVSGRLVEELSPQDNLRSPGWHQVRWSGANLPGGIYIVKIYLPEGIVSKKLILLK